MGTGGALAPCSETPHLACRCPPLALRARAGGGRRHLYPACPDSGGGHIDYDQRESRSAATNGMAGPVAAAGCRLLSKRIGVYP